MEFEKEISSFDLLRMVIDLVETGYCVTVELADMTLIVNCVFTGYDHVTNGVSIQWLQGEKLLQREIPLLLIKSIGFDFFYSYNGYAAKEFHLD